MRYVYPFIGNDPEMFITEEGRVVPAQKILNRVRETAWGVHDNRAYKVKVDNAAVELNFPAETCLQSEISNMSLAIRKLHENYLDKAHGILLDAAAEMSKDDMKKYSSLLQFGCDPSLLFYDQDLRSSKPNVDPRTVRHRSIGYHVHLGSDKPTKYWGDETMNNMAKLLHTTEGRVRLVQMCDMVAGLPAVLLERNTEAVKIRRNVLGYGRAGEFREQPHGFEYRTLGPWPIIHPKWAWWANSAVRDALQLVMIGVDKELIKKIPGKEVSDAINTNDFGRALKLWVAIKRNLADLIVDKRIENGKHAILGLKNIRLFEFAVASGGLYGQVFDFKAWKVNSDRYYWPTFLGFPNASSRQFKSRKYLNNFMAFSKNWELTSDNLNRWL